MKSSKYILMTMAIMLLGTRISALLLKKVEELSIFVIQQEKESEILRNSINKN